MKHPDIAEAIAWKYPGRKFTCVGNEPVEGDIPTEQEQADALAEWQAYKATEGPLDANKASKLEKAICIYFGQLLGKTPAQVRAGVKAVYDALP